MTKRNKNNRSGSRIANQDHNVQIVRMPSNVFGFPDRLRTKLRYVAYHNLTSTTGALGTLVYRWNSLFDPYQTGVGHQPLYYDTLAGVYDHYAVISAKAKISFSNPSATVALLCGVVTDDDTTTSTTFETLMEQSHGRSALVSPLPGSKNEWTVNPTWDCASILGIDPYASQTYKTGVGSNPSEESILAIWQIPSDGASTIITPVRVEIEFDALFTELSTPTQS